MNYIEVANKINVLMSLRVAYTPESFENICKSAGMKYVQITSRSIRRVSTCFNETQTSYCKNIYRVKAVTPEVVERAMKIGKPKTKDIESERKDKEAINWLKSRGYKIFKEV